MSEEQKNSWEEEISSSSSDEELQVLVAQYLVALGVVPQVFL